MALRWFLAAACVTSVARAEIRPSFHLPSAARYASQVLLVQDGSVVESWKGRLPEDRRIPGPEPTAQPVVYGFGRVHPELVLADLKRRGVPKVETVTGKRMVHFLAGETVDDKQPPHSYHRQRQSAAQWALDSMR